MSNLTKESNVDLYVKTLHKDLSVISYSISGGMEDNEVYTTYEFKTKGRTYIINIREERNCEC